MFKLIGSIFLLFGAVGYSFCLCREMRERLKCFYELRRMYELFLSQIGYSAATFPELCRKTEGHMKPPFSKLLQDVYREAEENTGKAFPKIWEEQVEKHFEQFGLKKEDKGFLAELSYSIGHADKELAEQAITERMEALNHVITKMETQMSEREKMIMSLGSMGGLLIVILLF